MNKSDNNINKIEPKSNLIFSENDMQISGFENNGNNIIDNNNTSNINQNNQNYINSNKTNNYKMNRLSNNED